eukprot:1301977-Prymnesium_polylepis.1
MPGSRGGALVPSHVEEVVVPVGIRDLTAVRVEECDYASYVSPVISYQWGGHATCTQNGTASTDRDRRTAHAGTLTSADCSVTHRDPRRHVGTDTDGWTPHLQIPATNARCSDSATGRARRYCSTPRRRFSIFPIGSIWKPFCVA